MVIISIESGLVKTITLEDTKWQESNYNHVRCRYWRNIGPFYFRIRKRQEPYDGGPISLEISVVLDTIFEKNYSSFNSAIRAANLRIKKIFNNEASSRNHTLYLRKEK